MENLPTINGCELKEYLRNRTKIKFAREHHIAVYTQAILEQIEQEFKFRLQRVINANQLWGTKWVKRELEAWETEDTYEVKEEIKTLKESPYLRPNKQKL